MNHGLGLPTYEKEKIFIKHIFQGSGLGNLMLRW